MHQTQWSPERPLPPPVSLASQSHHCLNPVALALADRHQHDAGAAEQDQRRAEPEQHGARFQRWVVQDVVRIARDQVLLDRLVALAFLHQLEDLVGAATAWTVFPKPISSPSKARPPNA